MVKIVIILAIKHMNQHTFAHLESIYRSYDIRGRYPEEINESEVEKIGAVLAFKYKTKTIAVGRDIRPSADVLQKALVKGITSRGCNVIDLGLVTTPMTYFVCARNDIDATVMITASHMPAEFNGLKISIEDAVPLASDVIQELKALVKTSLPTYTGELGTVSYESPLSAWQQYFHDRFSFSGRTFKLVIDTANMIGGLEIDTFKQFPNLEIIPLYSDFNASSPKHEANPMKSETLSDLRAEVLRVKADFGIAFDGDADRVGFVDDKGEIVSSDLIGALLVKALLAKQGDGSVVYDPRSSRTLPKIITAHGAMPVQWKVGHSHIRTKMRELNAVLGIELSGHFFFRETHYSEGGPLPAFLILKLLGDTDRTLSELVNEIKEFYHTGEINSEISRAPELIYEDLRTANPDAKVSQIDGLTLEYPRWWCNVRPSANDPVLRLNLEADSRELMEEMKEKILGIIRS